MTNKVDPVVPRNETLEQIKRHIAIQKANNDICTDFMGKLFSYQKITLAGFTNLYKK